VVRVELLLGAAGSGKTFRCLSEIRGKLSASAEGLPLVLLAPKQATYQLERQLLTDGSISGFTRLHVLSFERLAHLLFDLLHLPAPDLLSEEGRVMVLRSLLSRHRNELKLFRASARLTGFAQQLSEVLAEFQRCQLTPENILQFAATLRESEGLQMKLQDLATMLKHYLDWLGARNLQDSGSLLPRTVEALLAHPKSAATGQSLTIEHLWVDGFADLSQQEVDFVCAATGRSLAATVTFCLDHLPGPKVSWISPWSVVASTFERLRAQLASVRRAEIVTTQLQRGSAQGRFPKAGTLRHLEEQWGVAAQPFAARPADLRVVTCVDPESEIRFAAREILRHARSGRRFREAAVLVRTLESYHHPIQRIFSRYGIPFFLDRRESVAHHPLAELTRSTLRTLAYEWKHEDWFAALKTGLVPIRDEDIDRLENEALARGWKGSIWRESISVADDARLSQWLAEFFHEAMPPFLKLAESVGSTASKTNGIKLADALRKFWQGLNVETTLERWAADEPAKDAHAAASPVHLTVWAEINGWLKNIELAFPDEPLTLREWLPILDAGLANLTVGLIPPALDQVVVGEVDRSRNLESQLVLVLGMNDTVFPEHPRSGRLLTDTDRIELDQRNFGLGGTTRQQIGRERYLGYVALTRATEHVILTWARQDSDGVSLNPSPFIDRLRQIFPELTTEQAPAEPGWEHVEHLQETVPLLAKARSGGCEVPLPADIPELAQIQKQISDLTKRSPAGQISPGIAAALYGPMLKTSVSRMEQFAACPFKFFLDSGLRIEERKLFELDLKEEGTFQHEALARFHEYLSDRGQTWRDVTPQAAREIIGQIAADLTGKYRDGLLQSTEQARFQGRVLTESLQDFVEIAVEWMRDQYRFVPAQVELAFGQDGTVPPWSIDLGQGRRLDLHGRIDRIDLWRDPKSSLVQCVVIDYKSGQKQLDPVLMANGVQLQLLGYLNVLRHWPDPAGTFAARRLVPAGVFYVNLRGRYDRKPNRQDALADPKEARKLAYRHSGRFDTVALPQLDGRPNVRQGDQFNFRLNKDGSVNKGCKEALNTAELNALLDSVESNLRLMGRQVFDGSIAVAPYRKGTATACDQCGYAAICRIDPWTHHFRRLTLPERGAQP
jgi:ATP-dependent helicase/nuclease subunit B